MAIFIKFDGDDKNVSPEDGREFGLKELQGYVDGYIELVYLPDEKIMVVNEEGLIHGLPQNRKASILARRPIVGNVVIISSDQIS